MELASLLEADTGIRYGTGTPPPIVEPGENTLPFVRATDIKENQIQLDGLLHISSKQDKSMDKCRIQAGEMILVRSGVNTGDCAVVPQSLEGSYAAYDLILRFNEKVLPEYVEYFLDTRVGRLQINVRKGRAAQPHINAEEVGSIRIPLPDLDTQHALVAEMEAARAMRQSKLVEAECLLAGIDSFVLDELALKEPKEEKKQIFALKFEKMGQTRIDPHFHHPDFRKLIEALQTTATERLGDIAEFSGEVWNPEKEESPTFRYIEISGVNTQTGEVTPNEIPVSEAPSRARMTVKQGDILVSLTRPHRGAIALLDKSFDNCIASTGFAVLRKITKENVLPEYLWIILHNPVCLRQMLQRSSGGNYPAITDAELKQILIPIPIVDIQKKIVAELQRRRTQARQLREEAESAWQEAKSQFEKKLLG